MEIAKDGLLETEVIGDLVVISFKRGQIRDEREVVRTLESLSRYVQSKMGLNIVLNMDSIEYLSSAGLGHLVSLLKRTRSNGSVLKLCSLRERIQELFEITRLTQIFDIYPGTKEAVDSFGSTASSEKSKGSAKKCPA